MFNLCYTAATVSPKAEVEKVHLNPIYLKLGGKKKAQSKKEGKSVRYGAAHAFLSLVDDVVKSLCDEWEHGLIESGDVDASFLAHINGPLISQPGNRPLIKR